MSIAFIFLIFQTIFFWFLIFFLHFYREKITYVPLYGVMGAMVILLHTLSGFGLGVVEFNLFFLVASTAYFTPILLGIFLLYLFDSPQSARKGFEVVLYASILQIVAILFSSVQDNSTGWLQPEPALLQNYFWSVLAFLGDVLALGVLWELQAKIKVPIFLKVITTLFVVLAIDAVIFDTGVFATDPNVWSIFTSNIVIRLLLSLVMGTIITYYLKQLKFSESDRIKPKNIWSIVDFSSNAEQIKKLEKNVDEYKELEKKLRESQQIYQLVVKGSSAGIWTWDIATGKEKWSDKFFELLGYKPNEISASYETFLNLLHPEDVDKTKKAVDDHFTSKQPFKIEYRLKTKPGEYRWFLGSGQATFDNQGKPLLMVGSIIDIHNGKEAQDKLAQKLKEVSKINSIMVDRELKMSEMKKQMRQQN